MYWIYALLEKRYGDVRKKRLLEKVEGYRLHATELRKEIAKKEREAQYLRGDIKDQENAARNWMHRYNSLHDRHLNGARRESFGSLKFDSDRAMQDRRTIGAR